MKDFIGQDLSIGDEVVMIAPQYRHLCRGTIKSFTPKNVRVSFRNTWNYQPPGFADEFLQSPDQLIKIKT